MDYFKSIRPYYDREVSEILQKIKDHSKIRAMLAYGFPELPENQRLERLFSCKSIADFQKNIMYQVVCKAMEKSIAEFTFEGFEKLEQNQAYLFISNHRDIILDTSLLNVTLHNHNLNMTASAIGDNLVKKKFLKILSMLNRNFIIYRNLPPREALESSKIVAEYIHHCIHNNNRSVWLAQREGRTKNGDDRTQQGVLKMLSLATPEGVSTMQYLKTLNIIPMSISYEFDPTDMLKIPALMAQHYGVEYVKSKEEDFENILQGLTGQKGRVHISVGNPLHNELDQIERQHTHINKQLQALAEVLDRSIHRQYKLFPANYIAYDLLNNTDAFKDYYNEKEFRQFERRLHNRSKSENAEISQEKFLEMYANPVKNKSLQQTN
ncbi:MAG: 1-acyl-sn-glycerol-3-phosphate acyltransferase [Bacteroidota bacterium]|nr:1-acyl-sn-glycerol-3-phosphate acyltransferase [Bacteroidota bacterium]